MINRTWNPNNSVTAIMPHIILSLLLHKWASNFQSLCYNPKLGHRFHALSKVCSNRDDTASLIGTFTAQNASNAHVTCSSRTCWNVVQITASFWDLMHQSVEYKVMNGPNSLFFGVLCHGLGYPKTGTLSVGERTLVVIYIALVSNQGMTVMVY